MRWRTRVIVIVVALFATLTSLLSCFSVLFWGWVAATPLTAEGLARARYNHDYWLAIGGASVLILIAAALALVWRRGGKAVR